MARANSSLPVPDSPSTSTGASLAATCGRMPSRRIMAALRVTMSSTVCCPSSCLRIRCRADRSRKVSTPPISLPRRSRRGAPLMLTGTLRPSGRRMNTDRLPSGMSCSMHARSTQAPSQMLEWNTSRQRLPRASCAGTPVISAAARLNEVMRQSRSTVNTPSATLSMMVSQDMSRGRAMVPSFSRQTASG